MWVCNILCSHFTLSLDFQKKIINILLIFIKTLKKEHFVAKHYECISSIKGAKVLNGFCENGNLFNKKKILCLFDGLCAVFKFLHSKLI